MADKFTGSEGEMISLAEAKTFVSAYKESPNFKANNGVKAIFYGKEKLQELLEQPGCKGIRIYYGSENDANGKPSPLMVLVGADENRDDMVKGKILDRGTRCPFFCPESVALDD